VRVRQAGLTKAELPLAELLVLAVLAGAFIALGAAFYTVTVTGSTLPFGSNCPALHQSLATVLASPG